MDNCISHEPRVIYLLHSLFSLFVGSFILSTFVSSVYYLYLTFGLTGVGGAFSSIGSFSVLNFYFEEKRSLAAGQIQVLMNIPTSLFAWLNALILILLSHKIICKKFSAISQKLLLIKESACQSNFTQIRRNSQFCTILSQWLSNNAVLQTKPFVH